MKAAFAAIVGRPSSGKSTLLNVLCGQKVSIVSPVPQTTRNQVRGIVNRPGIGQIVFLDTPGFHLSDKKFNLAMMENVTRSLHDADLVLYLLDSTRPAGAEENSLVEILKKVYRPIIAVLNKTELHPNKAVELEELLRKELPVKAVLSISALKQTGIDELLKGLFELAPEGEAFYPEEYYTDQNPNFRVSEIIREQAINRLTDEIPHAVYVEVADLETSEDGTKLWIRAFLTVDTESQVGIVVGKGGEKIKLIRQAAQKELGKIFTQRIHLDLRVKVNSKWRSKDHLIKDLLGTKDTEDSV